MNEQPKYKVGDRVARAITSKWNLSVVTGWRRGTVTGVSIHKTHTVMVDYFFYEVKWDGDAQPSGGFWEGGIIPEVDVA